MNVRDRDPSGGDLELTVSALRPPRYMPFAVDSLALATWYDCQEDRYLVLCPECHRLITYKELHGLYVAMVWSEHQWCQGCRAKFSFQRDPCLIGQLLELWYSTGAFPQSPSWVEGIPLDRCYTWAAEIRAGLDAATAPLMAMPPMPIAIDAVAGQRLQFAC